VVATERDVFDNRTMVPNQRDHLLRLSPISCNTLDLPSSAELAITTSAEQVEKSSSICDDSGMTSTANYLGDFLIKVQLSWLVNVRFVWVAKLTVISVAPSVNLALIS
jgi:hypothetical protein